MAVMAQSLTVSEVIDALGGTLAAAEIFGVTMPAVSNWRAEGKFPPARHLQVYEICQERGIKYHPTRAA